MYQIPVFKAERDAGVADLVRGTASVAFATQLVPAAPFEIPGRAAASAAHIEAARARQGDFDLEYIKTRLVSTGMNLNDDYFDPVEVFAARATPEDKPINDNHDCARIIGHMVGNWVSGDDGVAVADDCAVEDLPAKFHVDVGGVLYKRWAKADLQKHFDQILADVREGKKFVSMECLFRGFDYYVVDKAGAAKIIHRAEGTAFLTKHLRAYGGAGKFQDYETVGRVLRNVVFSGKGIVDQPANPESVIFASAPPAAPAVYQLVTQTQESETSMATETETALRAEIDELKKKLVENDTKQIKASLDSANADKAKLEADLKAANDLAKAAADEHAKTKAELAKLAEAHAAAQAELDKAKAEKKAADRLAAVKAAFAGISDEDAKAFADAVSELNDEKFAKHLETMAKFTPAKIAPKHTPAAAQPQSTDLPAPMAGSKAGAEAKPEEDAAAAAADAAALETAQPEQPAHTVAGAADGVEIVRNQIGSFFGLEAATK